MSIQRCLNAGLLAFMVLSPPYVVRAEDDGSRRALPPDLSERQLSDAQHKLREERAALEKAISMIDHEIAEEKTPIDGLPADQVFEELDKAFGGLAAVFKQRVDTVRAAGARTCRADLGPGAAFPSYASAMVLGAWQAEAEHGHRRSLERHNHGYDHGYRDDYRFDQDNRGVDCRQYSEPLSAKACRYGKKFGHGMAQALGSVTGKHNGFLIGYKRSKENGFGEASGKSIDVTQGRSSVHVPNGFVQRLIEENLWEIRGRAAEEGGRRGRADAVHRFEAILNTGRPVDDRIDERALTTTYGGERGMAEKLLPRPSAEELIRDDLGYRVRIRVYDYDQRSEYDFHEAISKLDIHQEYNVWEMDAAAERAESNDWWGPTASARRTWSLFYHTRARQKSPWAELGVDHPDSWYPPEGIPGNPDLRAIFKQAFFDEYKYRVYGAYKERFYHGLDEGSHLGYSVGYNLGRQSTYYTAQAGELDRVYEERSREAYNDAYGHGADNRGGYENSFLDTVATYKTNPVVSVEITGIESLDSVDDSIISPGEPVRLIFSITNLGLVGTALNGKIGGSVDGVSDEFEGEVVGSVKETFRSAAVTIAENVRPRQIATLSLDLRVVKTGEYLSDSFGQVVNNIVELTRLDVDFEVVRGSGTVAAVAENRSTRESPAAVSVVLSLPGEEPQMVHLGVLATASSRTAHFSFSGQDPLHLIGQERDLRLELIMGDKLMETTVGSIGEPNKKSALVDYFDALYGGPIQGYVPPAIDHQQRRKQVQDLIIEVVKAEIARYGSQGSRNIWKYSEGAAEFIVGMMARKRLDERQNNLGDSGYRGIGKRLQGLKSLVQGYWKRRAFKKRALEIEKNREA